jgi:hypothetical protein
MTSLDLTARRWKITIYQSATDLVGKDISDFVSQDGVILQQSPFTPEAPVTCTAEFTLIADSDGNSALDLDPDTSIYIRPGAPIYFQYYNYAGTLVDVPWGARQVIVFTSPERPDSYDLGGQAMLWSVKVQTQQTLKQQQTIESAFDLEYGQNQPGLFSNPSILGNYRSYISLLTGIGAVKGIPFVPQPGDPVPAFQYNASVTYDPYQADSAFAYVHKLLYYNPNTSGRANGLWQDNAGRMRVFEANLKTTRTQADTLFSANWAPYSADLIAFRNINGQRQQLPGILRVVATARWQVAKTNPLVITQRTQNAGGNGVQITEAYSSTYIDWSGFKTTIIKRTTVPQSQIVASGGSSVSIGGSTQGEQETTVKTYTQDQRLWYNIVTQQWEYINKRILTTSETKREGPAAIATGGASFGNTLLSREVTQYFYKIDDSVDYTITYKYAHPDIVEPGSASVSIGGDGLVGHQTFLSAYGGATNARHSAGNSDTTSQQIVYSPVSNTNAADAVAQNAEVQESPWETKTLAVYRDRILTYNGQTISGRVKTINVGAFVFDGSQLNQLADNLLIREGSAFSQHEIKFALTDDIAAAWTRPGMAVIVDDYLTNKTKVFGSFGGSTIKFGAETVECIINGEYLGTVQGGNQLTAAQTGRVTLSGAQLVSAAGAARVTL